MADFNVEKIDISIPPFVIGGEGGFLQGVKNFFDETKEQVLSKDPAIVQSLMASVLLLAVGVYLWRRL